MGNQIYTIATICSGAGGVEIGAKRVGIDPIWGIDIDPEINALHKYNFPDVVTHDWDLSRPGYQWDSLQKPDLLHISPPCQSYSKRKTNGFELKSDIAIATNFCQAIEVLKPKYITVENVSQYSSSFSWMYISDFLFQSGYYVSSGVFNMSDWGVPQDRKRFVAIASRNSLLPSIKIPYLNAYVNVISEMGDSFKPTRLTKTQVECMRDDVKELVLNKGREAIIQRVGIQDVTKVRFSIDRCWTLLASIGGDGKGGSRNEIITYAKDGQFYNLTVNAIARLQSFPDWYSFNGFSNRVSMRGIGNSVPPVFYANLVKQLT